MNTPGITASTSEAQSSSEIHSELDHKPSLVTSSAFLGMLIVGLVFVGYSLVRDINDASGLFITWLPHNDISVIHKHLNGL